MIDIVISLVVVAFLLLLLYWNRRVLEASVVEPLELTLPPQGVVDRLFSTQDFTYTHQFSKRIQTMFFRDRRALALTWIRQIRRTTMLLTREHVAAVRRTEHLHLWTEFRIAVSFALLLFSCELFILSLATLGPVRSKILISSLSVRLQSLQAQLGGSYLAAYGSA